MKSALGFLLLAGVMTAQPLRTDRDTAANLDHLSAILQALKDSREFSPSLSNQLVGVMMAMADPGHPPSLAAVAAFADVLTSALTGKNLSTSDVIVLRRSIADVLRSSGATFIPASRLRERLSANGTDPSKAQDIIKRYIAIGEEVRGPDDLQVLPKLKK